MTLKYLFDRLFALLGIVILSPVILVVAILVRVKIGKPVLFKQERVGKDGKLFTILKFRTMEDENEGSSVCVAGDERILPLGVKLRKYKLDELPQLWNVLKGDMSFVGPRPDVPGYADQLQGDDLDVLKLRPGITGPATLKYRDEEELLATVDNPKEYNDTVIFPDKVRINCYYLHHHSFWTDLKILFATVLGKKLMYAGERI
jgi:lipopolysaccharide/colanic/teichoic acid biosynthesis glycosyltransferase